jgi:hypothetical protein
VLIRTIGAIRVQSCALFIAARNSFGSSGVRQELAGTTIKIRGSGFKEGARIEAILGGSPTCLTFAKKAKVKSGGTVLGQRGKLTNGANWTRILMKRTKPSYSAWSIPMGPC